ncbi:hypothetical protein H0H93_014026, partial [Arthromyces matolae]
RYSMIPPPTSKLPPSRRISSYPLDDLRETLSYLRRIYSPQIRGSQRYTRNIPLDTNGLIDNEIGLDELRADAFERSFTITWLTSLVSMTGEWDSSLDANDDSIQEWESLIQDAASLLALCSGPAGAGAITRDFVFHLGPTMERTFNVHIQDIALNNEDFASVGAQTWGGACVLAETIFGDPVPFGLSNTHELRILELGAGTGLVSLALGKLFESAGSLIPPRTIIATDYYPAVLKNLASNIELNFAESNIIESHFLDWSSFPNDTARPPPFHIPFDLVVGADVVYEPQHAIWIKSCLNILLQKPTPGRDPLFHLMVPLRATHTFEVNVIENTFAPSPLDVDDDPSKLSLVM